MQVQGSDPMVEPLKGLQRPQVPTVLRAPVAQAQTMMEVITLPYTIKAKKDQKVPENLQHPKCRLVDKSQFLSRPLLPSSVLRYVLLLHFFLD